MDPVTQAVLTSVGSDLGSAVVGKIFGGGKSRPDPVAEQIRLDHQQLTKKFKWAVEGAQKAGLHPLFALGQSATQSTPVPIDGSREAAGVAVDVGRAVRAGQAAKYQKEEHEMARERHFYDLLESASRRRLNDMNADYVMKQARDSEVERVIRDASRSQDGKGKVQLGALGSMQLDPNVTDAQVLSDRRGEAAELLLIPQLLKEGLESAESFFGMKKYGNPGSKRGKQIRDFLKNPGKYRKMNPAFCRKYPNDWRCK